MFCELIGRGAVLARFPGAAAVRPLPDSELAPGHTLVVPLGHVDGLLGASGQQLRDVLLAMRTVADGMRRALGATGTCVLQASGPGAGGSVPHLHFHVVPCWEDDGVVFWP